jgi:SAM-dependent methyltransferase
VFTSSAPCRRSELQLRHRRVANSGVLTRFPTAVAKSRAEGGELSEKSFAWRQAGLRQTTQTSRRNPGALARSLLWWQIRCVESRRSVGCTSYRSNWEILANSNAEMLETGRSIARRCRAIWRGLPNRFAPANASVSSLLYRLGAPDPERCLDEARRGIKSLVGICTELVESGGEMSDPEFVRRAYRLLLCREPDDEGFSSYTRALADGPASRAQVVGSILASKEFQQLSRKEAKTCSLVPVNPPHQVAAEFLRASEEFNQRALRLGLGDLRKYFWYHTVELPFGLLTPGLYDYRTALPCFAFPENMQGMTVLEIGAATGFFTFEFEKRGARVISLEIPSLAALDRFPGQTPTQTLEKIQDMLAPDPLGHLRAEVRKYSADELYFYLLEGPFTFCHRLLNSRVERRSGTVYELSEKTLGVAAFDLVFLGDILLHTLHPLQALAAVAPLCGGTLVLSQAIPEAPEGQAAMLYVGGEDPAVDFISWWLPNKLCLVQLLKKLGFRNVIEVGQFSGVQRSDGSAYNRTILHAVK